MRVIIAGSRTLGLIAVSKALADCPFAEDIDQVISGCATGVDMAGEEWAAFIGIPVKRFPANWDLHGKRAGFLRNKQMAGYAQGLVAVWDGKSRGTADMISQAKEHKIPYIYVRTFVL